MAIECTCNPDAHQGIHSSDTRLIRRVRSACLRDAERWELESPDAAICARYTAHLCLLRLRELKLASAAPSPR
jgi:hypothetical protein